MQIPKASFILQWSRSVRLDEGENGFSATVRVPWGEKLLYKFIVDGRWTTIDDVPTEVDRRGNVNNIYYTPARPREVDTPRYERPAVQQLEITPTPTPVPEEDVPVISRPPALEPRMSIIPTPAMSIIPDRAPVESVPPPVISLIRAPVSVDEEGVLFAAKPSHVKEKGKSISGKNSFRKKRDSFIGTLKDLFTLRGH